MKSISVKRQSPKIYYYYAFTVVMLTIYGGQV